MRVPHLSAAALVIVASLAEVSAMVALPSNVLAQDTTKVISREPSGPPVAPRVRVVGVFDAESGEPIEGADVRDATTGLTAQTTRTGTMGLVLLYTTGTVIGIRKVGYQPATMLIGTALADTTPITATLVRAGHVLAAVVVTASGEAIKLGKADTVHTLIDNGFYLRRLTTGAPLSAFVTADRLKTATSIADERFVSGRELCLGNLYVDGIQVHPPPSTGRFRKEGIDAMYDVDNIAGIEIYQHGELPVGATHTMGGAQAFDANSAIGNASDAVCATFIWLKR